MDGGSESTHTIGTLSDFEPIDFSGQCVNTIDAAIASTQVGQLGNETPAEGYGAPWNIPVQATSGLDVQKFGRSSGLTFGEVIAVNATVEVGYGKAGIACFKDQVIISPGEFSIGGDSGSLVVASSPDLSIDTRPVGLLFAGSTTISVANRIDNVLARFGVEVDGRGAAVPPQGGGDDDSDDNDGDNDDDDDDDDDDDSYEATAQSTGELFIRVVDSNNNYDDATQICVYSSAGSGSCTYPEDHVIDNSGSYNWGAQIDGEPCSVCQTSLSNYTQYIIKTPNSSNAVYLYREPDGIDGWVVVTTGTTDTFTSASAPEPEFDLGVVEAVISNVSVETPNWTDYSSEVTWDVVWEGGGSNVPSFFPQDATIKIKDGTTYTTLTSSGSQDYGSGSYDWTPSQEHTSIQIQAVDNDSGDSSLSSSFSVVDRPLTASISGSTTLEVNVSETWTASVVGGESPYTYDWDWTWICNEQSVGVGVQVEACDTWNQGGTSTTWSKSASSDYFDMKIRLTVTDSDNPANQDIVYFIVDIYVP